MTTNHFNPDSDSRNIFNLFPPAIVMHTVDDGLCLTSGPFILTHEEAYTILDRIQKWYEHTSPDDIERNNKSIPGANQEYSPEGYVYLIHNPRDGLYKIGKTQYIEQRFKALRQQEGDQLVLLHTIYCKDHDAAEIDFHAHYQKKRVRGEWFRLDPDDVTYIKGIDQL